MATLPPVSDTPEVADHYATQVALTTALVAAVRRLRPRLGAEPSAEYLALVSALVAQYAESSVTLSADYYEAMRDLAGVRSPYRTPIVEPPSSAVAEAAIVAALAQSAPAPALEESAVVDAVANLIEGITQELVAEAGLNQIWTALEGDREARGWARVTRANACSFCRMLATRGAVYKTERSANFRAHVKDESGGGTCQCTVEPLFGAKYEPPAHTRADQQLWSESTGDDRGSTNKLNAFRRAVYAQQRDAT